MTCDQYEWPIEHMRKIGAKGGAAGRGACKRRSKEFYKKLAKLAVAARKAKRKVI